MNDDVDVDDILKEIDEEDVEEEVEEEVEEIDDTGNVDKIIDAKLETISLNKENRKATKDAVEQMEKSIKANGVLVPVMISEKGKLVDGERRVRACRNLGVETVPAIVVEPEKKDSARVVTNFIRENFSEEYLKKVFEQELENATQQEVAEKYGITQARVSQIVNQGKADTQKRGKSKKKKSEKKQKKTVNKGLLDTVKVNDDIALDIYKKHVEVVFRLSNKDLDNVFESISQRVSDVDWTVVDYVREGE